MENSLRQAVEPSYSASTFHRLNAAMPDKPRNIEPETQHEKKKAATQEVPVDKDDVEADSDQETQHVKKQAATQPESDEDE